MKLHPYKNHGHLFQYLATISGVFSVVTSGINLGWTSPYLPQLLAPSSPIPTTSDQGSWCAVMPLVGAPVGAFAAAILADLIGRKYTTLLMTPVVLLSFIGIALADTIFLISAFRFAIGATEGALYTVLPMYIGEISAPQIRGLLTSTVTIAGILGTLFINIIGQHYSIFTSSMICAMVPLLHFFTFVWMPKSPYYLIKKGDFKEAERSLKLLRGRNDVEEEMESLKQVVATQEESKGSKVTDLFTVPSNRRACFIFIIVCVTNKFSGKNPCMFYTTMIFEEAGTSISPDLSVIIYCVVELIATMVAITVVDRFGRRPLLIGSTVGCSIALFSLAIYFYMKHLMFLDIVEALDWLPITSLIVYNVFFSMGLAFANMIVLSELFPTNVKAVALGFADSFSVAMGTAASKFFQITNDAFGMYVPFWAFSACCVVGLIFIVKFVPETKGKTLAEIQYYLIRQNEPKQPQVQLELL